MKFLMYSLLISSLILTFEKSYGTAQIPDYLIYKGDTVPIKSYPLAKYFENNSRPNQLFEQFGISSTNCWRGYIGYWELKNDSLFLIKLQGDSSNIKLSSVFDMVNSQEKLFVDWFDGSIFAQFGRVSNFSYIDYSSIYEFEEELIFKNGKFIKSKQYDNSKSKRSKYSEDNELLSEFIKQNINNTLLPDSIERVVVLVRINTVTESGIINNVTVESGYNSTFDNEAMRVIKLIPEWDVIFSKGKQINLPYLIPVVFDRKRN